jgi:hypothetical protein
VVVVIMGKKRILARKARERVVLEKARYEFKKVQKAIERYELKKEQKRNGLIMDFKGKHSTLHTPSPSKKAKVDTRRERQKRMLFGEATTPQLGKRVLEFQTPPKMPPVKGKDSPKTGVQGARRLANSTSDAVPAMPAIGTTEWLSKGKKHTGRMEIGMTEAYRGYTDTYTATDDLTMAGSFCLTAEEALRRTVARRIRWIRRDLDQTDVGRSDPVPARPLKVLPVKAPTVLSASPEALTMDAAFTEAPYNEYSSKLEAPLVKTPPVQSTSNKLTSMEEILTEAPCPEVSSTSDSDMEAPPIPEPPITAPPTEVPQRGRPLGWKTGKARAARPRGGRATREGSSSSESDSFMEQRRARRPSLTQSEESDV